MQNKPSKAAVSANILLREFMLHPPECVDGMIGTFCKFNVAVYFAIAQKGFWVKIMSEIFGNL